MKSHKYIVDTTLRDGEQSPLISFTRNQKLSIAKLLDDFKIHQIEAGIPSSNSYEKETIQQIIENNRNSKISVWCRMNLEDIKHCIDCSPDIIHMSIPISYVHIYSKLRKNKTWVINKLYSCLGLLQTSNAEISIGFEDASRADMSFMVTMTRTLYDLGVTRIRLSDTAGVMTPSSYKNMIQTLFGYVPTKTVDFGCHAHNDLGMALANTVEALKTGCKYADTTLFGIGERTGNCDFFKLIKCTNNIFNWQLSIADVSYMEENLLEILKQTV